MFSLALTTAYSFTTMINLIFKGEADTLAGYAAFVIFAALAAVGFGMSMAELVTIINDLK